MEPAVILFGHGAREPEWAAPLKSLQSRLKRMRPQAAVELAFLEIMEPDLGTCVDKLAAQGVREINVVPVFLAQGGHLKHDLPLMLDDLRKSHPGIFLSLASPIGEVDAVLDAMAAWICEQHIK